MSRMPVLRLSDASHTTAGAKVAPIRWTVRELMRGLIRISRRSLAAVTDEVP